MPVDVRNATVGAAVRVGEADGTCWAQRMTAAVSGALLTARFCNTLTLVRSVDGGATWVAWGDRAFADGLPQGATISRARIGATPLGQPLVGVEWFLADQVQAGQVRPCCSHVDLVSWSLNGTVRPVQTLFVQETLDGAAWLDDVATGADRVWIEASRGYAPGVGWAIDVA